MQQDYTENELSKFIFDAALKVHKALGPGLLRSAYEECLYFELVNKGLTIEKHKPLPLEYENVKLEVGYRIGLFVNKKVIVDVKSVDALNDIDLNRVLTYLRLSNCKLGMIINFNVPLIKNGVKRVVNKL